MNQNIQDDGDLKKYYAVIPHMADDDLDPYQYRLYGHYKRVCGQEGKCWESVKTTATKCKMSTGMVTKTRNELQSMGYIKVEKGANDNDTCNITITDRWIENMTRYAKRSQDEQSVHTMNDSVHHMKQRITPKEEPIKKEKRIVANATPKEPQPKKQADPNSPYGIYEQLETIQRGINKGQTLKEAKALLESGFSPTEIVDCAKWIMTEDWHKRGNPLNPIEITRKIDNWKSQNQPITVHRYSVTAF